MYLSEIDVLLAVEEHVDIECGDDEESAEE